MAEENCGEAEVKLYVAGLHMRLAEEHRAKAELAAGP